MSRSPATFSESWYRIANRRIWLRSGLHVRRQSFRGELWVVLEDPFSNRFFRMRRGAYEFVARLSPQRTIQEAWKQCLDVSPDDAPGQEAVIQLLSQLYHANLLHYENASDTAQLFERHKKRKQRELRARLMNVMFMRFPLLDPDRFLVRTLPLFGKLITPIGALLWLIVVGWALKISAENFDLLWEGSQSVLAPENLFLLYVGSVTIKALHEFGHAYFCRKFGGEVHVMGIMLMIFTPMPYVDATSSWGLRSRWKRILVSSAGMIVEVFVAALMVFVWAKTGPGTIHSLAYNMIFVASISTLVFNLNPLLRFDGYYILSDLLEVPNLHQRANAQLRHLCEHYLFGVRQSFSPAHTPKEAAWLLLFSIASGIYRVVVFAGILLVVADRFFIIGMIMAAVCLMSWVLVPVWRFLTYLASNPRLERVRTRAIGVSASALAVVLMLLGLVKFPSHFRAAGILQARERSYVIAETSGYLTRLLVEPGSPVAAGQPLLEFSNAELELELEAARAGVAELEARLRVAMHEQTANLKPVSMRLEVMQSRVAKLENDKAALLVKARHAGVWSAPDLRDQVGRWITRGTQLGLLLNPESFDFTAIVKQDDGDALFSRRIAAAEVRLHGQAGQILPISHWKVIPAEQNNLPSAALGWASGGETQVAPDNPQKAVEPFFEVRAKVEKGAESDLKHPESRAAENTTVKVSRSEFDDSADNTHGSINAPTGPVAIRSSNQKVQQFNDALLLHGRSGKIRFTLEPEPLLSRWLRRLNQLLQKRYQL